MSISEERLKGINSIVYELYNDLQLMEFINFELHKEVFNAQNNLGLLWFSRLTISNQAIAFYKLFSKGEKHSFRKLFNLAVSEKKKIDKAALGSEISAMEYEYAATDFETFRCKFLAHQDTQLEGFEVRLLKIKCLTEGAINLFYSFQDAFGQNLMTFDDSVKDSFREIFSAIDEYEQLKGYLLSREISGKESVTIKELSEAISSSS